MRGTLLCIVVLLPMAVVTGCGYGFSGKALQDTTLQTEVESAALEPGLPLALRRALDTRCRRHGIRLVDEEGVAHLRAMLESVSAEPAGIAYIDKTSAHTGSDSVAATSYRVTVLVRASLELADGTQQDFEARGEAVFDDLTLPLATDDARRAAVERATAAAADDLALWLASVLLGHAP